MLLRATIIWILILVFAVLNGILREGAFLPEFGRPAGFILSGILLSCVIFAVAYLSMRWIAADGAKQLLLVGFLWLTLTLAFEFSFGLARGVGLNEILAAYSFKDGNIWPVVLFVTFFAPLLTAKFRHRAAK